MLVLTFNNPHYKNIHILHEMYDGVFGKVLTCGSKPAEGVTEPAPPDVFVDHIHGYLGYQCLREAMALFPTYRGYLYGNDDMIINWWTLLPYDKDRIWTGVKHVEFEQDVYGPILRPSWTWWVTRYGFTACKLFYEKLRSQAEADVLEDSNAGLFQAKKALDIYLANGLGKPRCGVAWSDFVYVPGALATQYIGISDIAYDAKLFLEIAVSNIIHSLDNSTNFENLDGFYLPDFKVGTTSAEFWRIYSKQRVFFHPYKMGFQDFDYERLKREVIGVTRKLCETKH